MKKTIRLLLCYTSLITSIHCHTGNTPADNSNVYGIDISKYQGNEMAFMQNKKDSLTFIICKATEGVALTDPDFGNNWSTIKDQGFVRGAYHFFQSTDDPLKQAAFFLSTVGSFSTNDLPPIIDIEEQSIGKKQSLAQVRQSLLALLQQLQAKTGITPMIYTNINIGNTYLNDTAFSGYPLWIAYYADVNTPSLPASWKTWHIWQRSENYHIGNTVNDFDMFNGSSSALTEFIKKR